jgi:hypothetical protein
VSLLLTTNLIGSSPTIASTSDAAADALTASLCTVANLLPLLTLALSRVVLLATQLLLPMLPRTVCGKKAA